MYKLYYYPGNANLAPHILLEEIGASYELVLVDRERNEQKSKAYMKLNPNGRIPTLVDGKLILFESAAICMYLADKHSTVNLLPPVEDRARAYLYQWLIYLTNTVQPEILAFHYPSQYIANTLNISSIEEIMDSIRIASEERLVGMFKIINDSITEGPYILGRKFSMCDAYLLMLSRWCRPLKHSPRKFPNLHRCLELVAARPTVHRAFEWEGLKDPYF
jgi:glutathione S-transferase